MQPGAPLVVVPPNPPLTPLQVVGGGRPPQQRHPPALIFSDVTQLFAHHLGALQVVVRNHQPIPLRLLFGPRQAHQDLIHHRRFSGVRQYESMFGHATQENKSLPKCPAYSLNPSFPITHWPSQRSPAKTARLSAANASFCLTSRYRYCSACKPMRCRSKNCSATNSLPKKASRSMLSRGHK